MRVFLLINIQLVIDKEKQIFLQSVDLQCSVGFDNFREGMIFETAVIPYFGSLYQCNKRYIFPISTR